MMECEFESHVGDGGVVGGGEVVEGLDGFEVGGDFVFLEEAAGTGGAGVGGDLCEIFGCEQALGEGGEDGAADFFIEEVVKYALGFGPAVEDGVGWLVDEAVDAHLFEDFDGLFEFFEGVFGKAYVEGFAGVDGCGQGGHGFLKAGVGIGAVGVEDIDVIEAEAFEGLIEGGEEVFAGAPFAVGALPHVVAGFGGDEKFVAVAGEVFGEDASDIFLSGAGWRAVVVGEVEVGDTGVEGMAHDGAGLLEVIGVTEVVPEA